VEAAKELTLSSGCPGPGQWHEFLRGQLAVEEVEGLAQHLEQCSICVQQLTHESSSDPLLDTCRDCGIGATPAASLPAAVQRLVDQIKQLSVPGGVYAPLSGREQMEAAAAEPADPAAPECLLGRYRLLQRIGAGGMGAVYGAMDLQLQRRIAVKIPRFGGTSRDRDKAQQRFLREVRLAAQVRHPHVCTIHDSGEDQGVPFVVMEHVPGCSLDVELCRRGRYENVAEAVRITAEVARGLEAVHACGIVHRDLKPANILLDANGKAILTDFGLASTMDPAQALTGADHTVGTPMYMAPEQVSAPSEVDARADLYSLGLVLYQMLTGRLPFDGTLQEQLWQRTVRPATPPSTHRPDLDSALEAILLKTLAQRPAERYTRAGELAAALEGWLSGIPLALPVAAVPARSRRHAWLALLLVGAVLGTGTVVWTVSRTPRQVATVAESRQGDTKPAPAPVQVIDQPNRSFALGYVNRAVFVPGGSQVAVSTPNNQILLLDSQTGEILHRLRGHGPCQLWALAVSRNGQFILSGGDDKQVVLWDREAQIILRRFEGHDASIKRVAFSSRKGRIVSASDDDTVRTWDMRSGVEVARFAVRCDGRTINATAFSADGRWFLNGRRDGHLELYDVTEGTLKKRWQAHQDTVCSVAFSADGTAALSGGDDRRLRCWSLDSYQMRADIHCEQPPELVTFLPDRPQVLSTDASAVIVLWDAGGPLCRWKAHRHQPGSLLFAPSGQEMLSLSGYGELMIWRWPT
jgi:hypothetical protein